MAAIPNQFDLIITSLLQEKVPTVESVAEGIASSEPFLKAIRIGMERGATLDANARAKMVRGALAQAFNASTANQMFDD